MGQRLLARRYPALPVGNRASAVLGDGLCVDHTCGGRVGRSGRGGGKGVVSLVGNHVGAVMG